jgi:lysozyme family protein
MTDLFPSADAVIVQVEGGFSNDSADPGGATKFGIAHNKHPEISDAAWQAFTFADAQAIRRTYWDACRCAQMPWPMSLAVYDDAINSGADAAARRLQHVLGVTVDGKIGPRTLAAFPNPVDRTFFKFMFQRAAAYATDQNAARFLNGWLNRLVIITEAARWAPEEVGTV